MELKKKYFFNWTVNTTDFVTLDNQSFLRMKDFLHLKLYIFNTFYF